MITAMKKIINVKQPNKYGVINFCKSNLGSWLEQVSMRLGYPICFSHFILMIKGMETDSLIYGKQTAPDTIGTYNYLTVDVIK
jgi:hypothetical protein